MTPPPAVHPSGLRHPFPFVVGCGRSGTTLVRAMLDAHPDLAVPGESYFPVWLARTRRRYHRGGGFDSSSFADDLLADAWFRRWALPEAAVRGAIATDAPADFADAVRSIYRLYARHHGKERYGDKTPTFVLHLPVLAELFPEAVFIHVVRDGRDVALSLLEADWGPSTLGDAALHWKLHVRSGARAGARMEPERYHQVRYEDLVEDPEDGARTLCRFVGLDFDAAMLRYFERAGDLLAGLPDAVEHQNLRLPPTQGIRNWRRHMTTDDVALFETLTADVLDRFGYERTSGSISAPVQARAARRLVAWKALRAGYRVRSLIAGTLKR